MKKDKLQNIISKYYLGINESVKWVIKDNLLSIDFMTSAKDLIGKIIANGIELEDGELPIFDTKKLTNLINICSDEIKLEINKNKVTITDPNYELIYTLSDPLLIGKVGTINEIEWDVELPITQNDINFMIKAKGALVDIDNMIISPSTNNKNEKTCEFIFGDDSDHNNKITYSIKGEVGNSIFRLPFNSENFRLILSSNKDMIKGTIWIAKDGLMKLEFKTTDITSEYYMVRKAENSF